MKPFDFLIKNEITLHPSNENKKPIEWNKLKTDCRNKNTLYIVYRS